MNPHLINGAMLKKAPSMLFFFFFFPFSKWIDDKNPLPGCPRKGGKRGAIDNRLDFFFFFCEKRLDIVESPGLRLFFLSVSFPLSY